MGLILCAHGGSGSCHAIQRLRSCTGHPCLARPDVAFFPHDTPELTTSWREGGQRLSQRGYDDMPTPDAAALFESRAPGHVFDLSMSIRANLSASLDRLAAGDEHVLLCRAPALGLLTSCAGAAWLDRTAALVRHPLQQYLSFTRDVRHPDWAEALGGVGSREAVAYFARAWLAFTSNCLDSGVRLIRFECAERDARASGDPLLIRLFEGWDSSRSNPSPLSAGREGELRAITAPAWSRLYRSWDSMEPAGALADAG